MSGISVATIKSPEFINVSSVSPMISKCEVKVLYVGANRNRSYITKEVASEMAKTLPGTPIVGYYSENKEDFGDHGDQVVIDGDGIKFNCLTKPYGFVPIGSKIWFQEFEDTDEFGNKEIREYLMCEGYLWTEQYKEAQKVINEGRPHSMELDERTLKGHWSTDTNRGIEFFIINDATFTKLCILGEDVEPCFEGSSVTSPDISSSFSLDSNVFAKTLYTMMQELKEFNKGGNLMENPDKVVQDPVSEGTAEVVEAASVTENTEFQTEKVLTTEDKTNQENIVEIQNTTEEFAKKSEDEKEKTSEDDSKEDGKDSESNDEDKEKKDKEDKYTILEQKFNELSEKYAFLEQQNAELLAFKNETEDKAKDDLIESFYMLSDEDKKNVIENKSKYSLDEIKKELSVICVDKKVSFEQHKDTDAVEQNAAITYTIASEEEYLPAWLAAVERNRNK